MTEQTNPRDEFRERVEKIIPSNRIETLEEDSNKLYLFPTAGGFGITSDCYDDLDVRFIESIGMKSLPEGHRLYRENTHHVLIFKVMNGE